MFANQLDIHVSAIRGLCDYGRLPGYAASPGAAETGMRCEIGSDAAFWSAVLKGDVAPGKRIDLKANHWSGFALSSWLPRVPGLYWKADSARLRTAAESQVLSSKEFTVYNPYGKSQRMLGGMGSVRLLPKLDSRMICASDWRQSWTGIPLLLRGDAFREYRDAPDGLHTAVEGVLTAIPKEYADDLGFAAGLPRVCLEVTDRTGISILQDPGPHENFDIGAWTLFEYRPAGGLPQYDYCYYNLDARNPSHMGQAVAFLNEYVAGFSGSMLTDFDESEALLGGGVRLPISELDRDISRLKLKALIERVKNETLGDDRVHYEKLGPALLLLSEADLRAFSLEQLGFDLDRHVGRAAGNEARVEAILAQYAGAKRRDLVIALVADFPGLSSVLAADPRPIDREKGRN